MISAKTLADHESLLSDSRVEQLRGLVGKELRLPDEVSFATYIQPPTEVNRKGVYVLEPARAVFVATCPNPHPRYLGKTMMTYATAELEDWRSREAASWRFVGVGDPAFGIFKAIARRLLIDRTNMQELN